MSQSVTAKIAVVLLCVALSLAAVGSLVYALAVQPQMTIVVGPITSDTVWTAVDSPYLISDPVTIQPGVTLTIEAGVTVMADGDGYAVLDVAEDAHLQAAGTAVAPVIFTSTATDVFWTSLTILGSAHFVHTEFHHSFFNIDLYGADGGPVVIENSAIRDGVYGLHVYGDALHRLALNNVTFTDNVTNSVYVDTREEWTGTSHNVLQNNAQLTVQPGLDGYIFSNYPLIISNGVKLTVGPGVRVMSSGDGSATFWVQKDGRFTAIGTPTQPITFTSTADSAPGQYTTALATSDNASVTIDHAVFQYGSLNVDLRGKGGEKTVRNSVFRNSDAYGMVVEAAILGSVQLDNLTFENNARNRIAVFLDCYSEIDYLTGEIVLRDFAGLDGYEFVDECYPVEPHRLEVPADSTLTLAAGVNLYLPPEMSITVSGNLTATGTAATPVVITGTVPVWGMETGDLLPWTGITLSGTARLDHLQVSGAAYSSITVQGGDMHVTCSQFTQNQGHGILVTNNGTPTVTVQQSSITKNTVGGVANLNQVWIDAQSNWWGAPDGPGGAGPGSGDAVTGNVLFQPWLSAPADCGDIPDFALYLPAIHKP